ncbi:unnamed protein product [Euphydryas editha]|uniref:N-terminal acetyltransferase B complex subunit MDM20 homolog n=1 Tax=Euphydryas editha TaxID=104508 RepID=A0AAU9U2Q7_EUPED|nr:unnamed protein product [Euphydryas editha]
MAVRPQHMHDGGIMERRLRPIYDWLDNGNNKKALQEAEKVLKKSPSLQAARALKALALYRLGKGPEAHALLDALTEEKPSDDSTLQAMTISYRESQQLHKVCALYEEAVKAEPTNEELYSHLFMSYVRVGDYRSQQRSAMALYKFAPKNPYYFWAVMSIVLQAKTTDDSTKKGILLSLAQRMVDNFISENKMEAEQEARLYIMILELQEKWKDILNFIEGPLYSQLVPRSTAQASIPYLKKLGHWRRLNLLCKDLLWDNQDRWDYYLPYFDSVFHLISNTEADGESGADDTAEKCHEFICQLVESMSSGRTLRGPYLARLELWKRLSVDGDPTALLGSGVALCIQYLRVFANKPCAVPDLKPYLAMIPQKEREDRCRDFLTCLGFDENSEPESLDDIQRHISCICAWRLTSPLSTADEYLNIATILRRQYLRCVSQKLITATPTEFCVADGYGTLAAHHYFYAAVQQQNASPIVEALCLLELVLHNSPANFHAKLLLISLYHLLGNAVAAESVYRRLEAKHVQLVSLGWLHAARLAPALAPARALRLLADTHAFHRHHAKDSMEHLTYAYKYGTFEKLVELGAWGARLEACAWCALAARERALLPLLAGPPAPLHAPPRLPSPPAARCCRCWPARPRRCTRRRACPARPREYPHTHTRAHVRVVRAGGPRARAAAAAGRPARAAARAAAPAQPARVSTRTHTHVRTCAWCALAARERALLPLLAGPPAPLHAPPRLPSPPAARCCRCWPARPRRCTRRRACPARPREYPHTHTRAHVRVVRAGGPRARAAAAAGRPARAAARAAAPAQPARVSTRTHTHTCARARGARWRPASARCCRCWPARPRRCTRRRACPARPREYPHTHTHVRTCAWCALAARERALLPLLAGPPAPLHAPPRLPSPPAARCCRCWPARPRRCTCRRACPARPREYPHIHTHVRTCAWCALAARERALLPLLAGPPAPLHAPPRLPSPPADNRDLNAIVSWEPPQCVDPELKARTFEQDVAYLRLKDGLVSAIALCIECSDSRSAEQKRAQLDELAACTDAFAGAMDKCRERFAGKQRLSVAAPLPARIIAFVSSEVPYRELYTSALRTVGALCGAGGAAGGAGGGAGGAAGEGGAHGRELGAALREHLAASLRALPEPPLNPWQLRDSLEAYSNYLEFIGVITFLLGVCNELSAPANTKKSKKKANQSPDQILTAELLSQLNDDVQDIIAHLENVFDKWPIYDYGTTSIEDELAKLDFNDKYQCPVEQKLKNGLQDVLTDVKNILKKKSKYLKTLQ